MGQAQLLQSLRIDLHDQFLEDGKYFFLGDNFQEGGPRVIGFATQRNLETLNNASTWMVDGTFSSCPGLFSQVWVIHGLVGEVFLPLVFFLLEGQDQGSYVTALQMVKGGIDQFEAPDQRRWARGPGCQPALGEGYPYIVLIDFEAAERLALVEVFGIELQGFFFHFWQAILCRIRNHHCPLHQFITSVENLGNWNILLLFVALDFLKDEDIGRGYQLIVQIPLIQENLDIFQGFWITLSLLGWGVWGLGAVGSPECKHSGVCTW